MTRKFRIALALMGFAGISCDVPVGVPAGTEPEATEPGGDPLLGGVNYVPSTTVLRGGMTAGCNYPVDVVPFLEQALFAGRVASQSRAFQECIGNLHVGMPPYTAPYTYCKGDPFPLGFDGQRVVTQREQMYEVLLRTRSRSRLTINCAGANGDYLARAPYRSPTTDREILTFNWTWLTTVAKAPSPVDDPAWPIWQVAATIWHEAMHSYTYRHDGSCNLPNTVPYIVDGCMGQVISVSGSRCPRDSCGSGSLNLVKSLNSNECECVSDPRP